MGTLATAGRRDVWAFAAVTAFVVQMYAVPGEWISAFAPLRLALVLSAAAALFFLLRRVGRRETVSLDGARGLTLIAFAMLGLASIAWSVDRKVSGEWALELLKLVAIYIIMVNVVSTPKRLVVIAGALVLASMVPSIGVIHWFHRGTDLAEGFRGRWVGVYADPNHMAENLAIALPLAASFIVHRSTPTWMRLLSAVAAVLATTAIVYSHSRGGFIGLAVAMGFWALRERQYRFKALIAGAALAAGMTLFAPKSFWDRNDTLQNFREDASALGRVYAWHVASAISLDRPLLGVGGGAFRYAWPLYAPPEAPHAYVAHNIYLDVIGELGWIGLFLFLIFSGGVAGAVFQASADRDVGWLARGLSAAVVGYLLCNCFSGYTLSAHLYVLFALAAAASRVSHREPLAVFHPPPRREVETALVPVRVRS